MLCEAFTAATVLQSGKPVITSQNAESFHQLVTDIVTDAAQLPEKKENTNEE